MGHAGLASFVAAAVGGALMVPACARPSGPDKPALQSISLPDLSHAAEPARRRIQESHSALMLKTGNPATTSADLASAYGEMGKLLMAADYFDAAESCFLNAQALAPNEPRWAYYLAQVYRTRGEPEKAVTFFERTLQLRPSDLAALVYLGDAHLARGQPDAAEPPLAKALALEPRLAVALFDLGRASLAKQDYAGAVQHLERALALDPQASLIHYPLAMAYRGLGDTVKAEAHLRQRGDARPGFLPDPLMQQIELLLVSAQAYEVRGTQAMDAGEWAAAAEYLRKGVQLAPGNSALRLKLAEALRRSGHPEESLAHYEQTAKLDPSIAAAPFGYAMALVQLRRYQEARDQLVEGMKTHAGQPAFPQALARLLASSPDDRVRDGGQALALVHELLKQQQNTDLGETMAMALAEVGKFEEAARLQRTLIPPVQRVGRENLVRVMTENLRLYERREACRTPWPEDAIP